VNAFDWAGEPSEPIRFTSGLPDGDGVLMYPGEAFGARGPPSVRLECLRDSLQDYEYLRLYEAKFGRPKTLARLRTSIGAAIPTRKAGVKWKRGGKLVARELGVVAPVPCGGHRPYGCNLLFL